MVQVGSFNGLQWCRMARSDSLAGQFAPGLRASSLQETPRSRGEDVEDWRGYQSSFAAVVSTRLLAPGGIELKGGVKDRETKEAGASPRGMVEDSALTTDAAS